MGRLGRAMSVGTTPRHAPPPPETHVDPCPPHISPPSTTVTPKPPTPNAQPQTQDPASVANLRGCLARKERQFPVALRHLSRAVAASPGDARFYYDRAQVCVLTNETKTPVRCVGVCACACACVC